MPTGLFGGFPFDPEVYGTFVDQEPTFTDSIYASGILATDSTMATVLNNGGTVGTARFYNPLDPDLDAPLVRDGNNDNNPSTISGGKQSWIRVDRMKAWTAMQLTAELTGADPMAAVARNTGRYWRMYYQGLLVKQAQAVLGLTALASHKTTATNGVDENLLIDAQQAALGEFANKFGLIVMHSKIFAEYQKLKLVNYDKYVITNAMVGEVKLPTINGLIVVVNDRGTHHAAASGVTAGYDCYLFGQGSILQATPKVITPDHTEYDGKLKGGTDVLYTNRSIILHPNGVSFKPENIAGETPTDAELATTANWDLRYQHQNVRIGQIVVPDAQL